MEAIEKIKAWPTATRGYVQELQLEMKRVTWPSWKQVRATTGVVIVTVFVFAAYFWVVDIILNSTVTRVFDRLTK